MVKSVIAHTNTPSVIAVRKTPSVESVTPCQIIGLMECQSVSNPPENRMKFNATIPINWAIFGLSKLIPPIPSEPANIPMVINKINTGTPNLSEVFPAIRDMKSRREPIKSMFSVVRFINSKCYFCGNIKILALLFVVGKLLVVPIKIIIKLLLNGIGGGIALFLFNLVGGLFGAYIVINPLNAIIVGILGLPGVILLLVMQAIL